MTKKHMRAYDSTAGLTAMQKKKKDNSSAAN